MIRLCAFADEADAKLQGQIDALKRNGISLLELRSIDGKNVSEFCEDEAKEYQKRLKENGISVWSIGSPLGKSSIDEDIGVYEQRVRHVCELARIFGARRIRAFSFFNAFGKKEEVFSRLQKTVDIAAEYGVLICHENEKGVYGETSENVSEIMKNVRGIRSVYDPANFLQRGQSAEKTLSELFDLTDYFHIKDVIAETQELVPAGLGDGRIGEIIERITDDKVLTLEPHLFIFEGYGKIDKEEMKNKFAFSSNAEAFDAAARALKGILREKGYRETEGGYVK